ncbi:MAG TPA: ABC transporter permease [Mycobacteriales bacterium]|nr:ABC transporter permease [Mycobacteriales bacterium]
MTDLAGTAEPGSVAPAGPHDARAGGGGPPAPGRPPLARALVDAVLRGNSAVVTALAILLALVVGALLIALSDTEVVTRLGYFFSAPGDTFSRSWFDIRTAYAALFSGAIVNPSDVSAAVHGQGSVSAVFGPISETIVTATPLICGGLSVSLAFRAGLFNIGGEGQVIAGALAAGYVGFAVSLPPVLHLVVAVAAGIAGGALWGFLAGWLKARTGAHEVITTIMLNYVAGNLLLYLLGTAAFQRPGRPDPISFVVHPNARLPHLAGPSLRLHLGIVLALAAAVFVWWLLSRSTLGFELRAVGSNPDAARTAGMSVGRGYAVAMLLAGGLAGLAGVDQALGTAYTLTPGVSANIGFDAITVALLGRASPLGTVLAGLLFGALRAGGVAMQAQTGVSIEMVTVLQSLIVILIAAPPLVRAIFRLRGPRAGGETVAVARGWGG